MQREYAFASTRPTTTSRRSSTSSASRPATPERARGHVDTVCVGRTHGVHAEPTTFGIKLAGFAMEASRNVERLKRAFAQVSVGAISGAVGTYAAMSPEFEERVLAGLGLEREPVSTQVVARDRHAELLQAIALAGAGLERLATIFDLGHYARHAQEICACRAPGELSPGLACRHLRRLTVRLHV